MSIMALVVGAQQEAYRELGERFARVCFLSQSVESGYGLSRECDLYRTCLDPTHIYQVWKGTET